MTVKRENVSFWAASVIEEGLERKKSKGEFHLEKRPACPEPTGISIRRVCTHSVLQHVQATSVGGAKKGKHGMGAGEREGRREGGMSAFLLTGACVGRDRIKTNDATETQKGGSLGFKGKQVFSGALRLHGFVFPLKNDIQFI